MLSLYRLALRNVTHHRLANLAVLAGVAVGSAVLTGALLVGDSLRGSLRARVERQLGGVESLARFPRPVPAAYAERLPGSVSPVLLRSGSLRLGNTDDPLAAGLSRVNVIGVDSRFQPDGLGTDGGHNPVDWDGRSTGIVLSHSVARKLGARVGDRVHVTVERFSALPRTSALARRGTDDVTASRDFEVVGVLNPASPANEFSLSPDPAAPLNVYVPLATLSELVGPRDPAARGRFDRVAMANVFLARGVSVEELNTSLKPLLHPQDYGLKFRAIERREPPGANQYLSVESDQLVLSPQLVDAVLAAARRAGLRAEPTVVYIAESLRYRDREIPYPVVAGLNVTAPLPLGPFLPPGLTDLGDDEVILLDWSGSELAGLPDRTPLELVYYDPEVEGEGLLRTATLTLRAPQGYLPLSGPARDKDLTPEIAGVTDIQADLYRIDLPPVLPGSKIRERVPDKPPHPRGVFFNSLNKATPMAYVNLATGQRLFGSRYGSITSVRVAPGPGESSEDLSERFPALLSFELHPEANGLSFEPIRERLLAASQGGTDFGGLFLGFSLFLITAALLLVGLLVRLSWERRARELGVLVAVGSSVPLLWRLVLIEGLALAALGAAAGLALGSAYNRLLLTILRELWPDPDVSPLLRAHATGASFVLGWAATVGLATTVLYLTLRKLVRVSAPALLRGVTASASESAPRRQWWIGLVVLLAVLLGVTLVLTGNRFSNPDYRAMTFFAGGGLLLAAGLLGFWAWMKGSGSGKVSGRGLPALIRLGCRNAARHRGRSLLTVALLASAAFLLVAVESFRRQTGLEFLEKTGGSGGFELIAETDVAVYEPLSEAALLRELAVQSAARDSSYDDRVAELTRLRGLRNPDDAIRLEVARQLAEESEAYRSAREALRGLEVYSLRLRDGDDASCLNLFQAERPRVIGVPQALIARDGFRFYSTLADRPEERDNPWLLLHRAEPDGSLPVFCEQNTAQWMLKKGLGERLTLPGDDGQPVTVRIVGTFVDSPFQSELVMADASFARAFPKTTGYRVFLIRTQGGSGPAVERWLASAYQGYGVVVQSTRERVATYQRVIGAYLSTFQLLGGLGLLLGVFGLAVVVLRGIWERVGELALLRAVGYRPRDLQVLVLAEHALLLLVGLLVGVTAALASVAPHVATGAEVPWLRLAAILGLVLLVGFVVATTATFAILRIPVIPALRRE